MFYLKNNILTEKNEVINSASATLKLEVDNTEAEYFGIIELAKGILKTIQFKKMQTTGFFAASLSFREEDIPLLSTCTLTIKSISNSLTRDSNTIKLKLDLEAIKSSVKKSASEDIKQLKLAFNELQTRINSLLEGKALQNINIVNKDYIAKGMIRVADENGNWIASFPFLNFITSINGIETPDGTIIIDANMIKYTQDKTIFKALSDVTTAIEALHTSIKTLTEQQKELRERVNDLSIELEALKNSGII